MVFSMHFEKNGASFFHSFAPLSRLTAVKRDVRDIGI